MEMEESEGMEIENHHQVRPRRTVDVKEIMTAMDDRELFNDLFWRTLTEMLDASLFADAPRARGATARAGLQSAER